MSVGVEQIIDEIDVEAIKRLVDDYQSLTEFDRDQMNEATVRQQYINPLLRALGWDTETDQVLPEQRTITGDADYALSLKGREQYFIEAKRFSADLDGTRRVRGEEQSYVVQAIDYAWHQGCDWAVLTNFAELRLYFTHVNKDRIEQEGLVLSLSADEYTTSDGLEHLAQLSKPAVQHGSLDALERSRGRASVTEEILNVLSEARVNLTVDVHESHPNLSMDELREGVQRILDRLVVMRVAEDRSVIPRDTLRRMSESWSQTTINPDVRTLVRDLKNAFRDFDSVYNSELFAEHECEEYEISNDVLENVIDDLYNYKFQYIDADVLGTIYEDYLGHAIEDKEDDSELELVAQGDHKREEGIFYTPVPVTQYIVESTLGERLDEIMVDAKAELANDDPDFEAARAKFDRIEELRFLDVTCGSGSFLIKAYDLFVECYEEYQELVRTANEKGDVASYSAAHTVPTDYKRLILENNIFGVDLDYQATEIATVNLLLKALRKDEKLPAILEENIKAGNSLLNGSESEVADVLGVTEAEARKLGVFEWEKEFSHVFDDVGGFDVIAGNPPWGTELGEFGEWLEHDEYGYELAHGQYDSYELFLELGTGILRDGGTLGFIVPDSILSKDSVPAREWLVKNYQLDRAFKLGEGLFENVYTGTAIIQYTNTSPDDDHMTLTGLIQKEDRQNIMGNGGQALSAILKKNTNLTKQHRFQDDEEYTIPVWAGEPDFKILDQMETGTVAWENVIDNGRGDEIGRGGNVLQCPYCTQWDTFPRKRGENKGGGYYSKTCSHCGGEFEFEEAVSTRSIIQDHTTDECDKPIYFGEHVNRYRTDDPAYIDDSIKGIGLKDEGRYEPPKLLIRQASVGFFTTVDYTDARCLQSVFSFRPKEEREEPFDQYGIEYFLGFLNSRAMLYYYSKTEGITEWQSYPRHTQTSIMSLPVPAVDFDDEEGRATYDEFVALVREAVESDAEIDRELDWKIERSALDLYGIPEGDRPRIWSELKKLQRLRIVRELFPDAGDHEQDE